MSLTSDMKNEIAGVHTHRSSEITAELASALRFASGLHVVTGRIVLEMEIDCRRAASRMRALLAHVYKVPSEVVVLPSSGLHKNARYVIRVVEKAEEVARATGLLDGRGRPVRGLPPMIIAGGADEARAAWRGAFLVRGTLTEPGRSSALEVSCPGPEAALALVGCARRLGVTAKSREVRGSDRVVVRDIDMIEKMIRALGAPQVADVWSKTRHNREVRGSVNRLANFDDANLRRSARAAVVAAARVKRAFEILGDDVPEHLVEAGKLRVTYKDASLEELGRHADPVLTKDAIAGRIRRLLAMADARAHELGIEDTSCALTSALLEDEDYQHKQ